MNRKLAAHRGIEETPKGTKTRDLQVEERRKERIIEDVSKLEHCKFN